MKSLIFIFLLFAYNFDSYAFMNIENLRRKSTPGLHGNGSFRLSGALGNTENLISDTSISNFYNTKHSEWLVFLNHRYGEAFSVKNADRGKAHLRYTFKMKERWGLESFTQGTYDDFQRLLSRYILGQGFRYKAYNGKVSSLYFGGGAFYEWERIESVNPGGPQENVENLRANFYASFHWDVKEKDTLFLTFYYQPYRFDDYRVISSAGYQIPLGSYFSLSIEANYAYDSKPPIEIEKTDIRYFTTLNYTY